MTDEGGPASRLFLGGGTATARLFDSGTFGNPCCSFPASCTLHRMHIGGDNMKKFLIAVAVSAFAVTSAVAQTAVVSSEYYVVRDATTKKCTVVDKKPTTTTTIVDNGTFKTKTEAETGMKTMKVCTDN